MLGKNKSCYPLVARLQIARLTLKHYRLVFEHFSIGQAGVNAGVCLHLGKHL